MLLVATPSMEANHGRERYGLAVARAAATVLHRRLHRRVVLPRRRGPGRRAQAPAGAAVARRTGHPDDLVRAQGSRGTGVLPLGRPRPAAAVPAPAGPHAAVPRLRPPPRLAGATPVRPDVLRRRRQLRRRDAQHAAPRPQPAADPTPRQVCATLD